MNNSGWRTAVLAKVAVRNFILRNGYENVGFYTITFPDDIDFYEANRRFNNWNKDVMQSRYGKDWIKTVEWQKNGRPHFHLVLRVPGIRDGCVIDKFSGVNGSRGRSRTGWVCTTVGLTLSLERRFWLLNAANYGFGRLDISPIYSSPDAAAFYVAKYLSKSYADRPASYKHARLLSMGSAAISGSVRFSPIGGKGGVWREAVELYCLKYGLAWEDLPNEARARCPGAKSDPGERWAHFLKQFIMAEHAAFCHAQPF